jgi:hypothetical protein
MTSLSDWSDLPPMFPPCRPFAVDGVETQELLRSLEERAPNLHLFPQTFQDLYATAWRNVEHLGASSEKEGIPMRHHAALEEAWHGCGELLAKSGAEVCMTNRVVCGCDDPAHDIITFRYPERLGVLGLGINYRVWIDRHGDDFCRDFADGRIALGHEDWGVKEYLHLTVADWREYTGASEARS